MWCAVFAFTDIYLKYFINVTGGPIPGVVQARHCREHGTGSDSINPVKIVDVT